MIERQGCPPIDLGLILDSSGSLNFGNNEQIVKEFALDLVDKFDVNPGVNGTRVSIIQFDNEATLLHGFNDPQTKTNVVSKINSYRVRDGQTFLNKALDLANTEFEEPKMRTSEYRKVRIVPSYLHICTCRLKKNDFQSITEVQKYQAKALTVVMDTIKKN